MLKNIAIFLIWIYQHTVSPIFRLIGINCRFYPTCSEYSKECFKKHGFLKGFLLSVRRISRCHPWGGSGIDNVP